LTLRTANVLMTVHNGSTYSIQHTLSSITDKTLSTEGWGLNTYPAASNYWRWCII